MRARITLGAVIALLLAFAACGDDPAGKRPGGGGSGGGVAGGGGSGGGGSGGLGDGGAGGDGGSGGTGGRGGSGGLGGEGGGGQGGVGGEGGTGGVGGGGGTGGAGGSGGTGGTGGDCLTAPDEVDFGSVLVHTAGSSSLEIENRCNRDVEVRETDDDLLPFSTDLACGAACGVRTAPAHGFLEAHVFFVPEDLGDFEDVLRLATTGTQTLAIPLHGKGAGVSIHCEPGLLSLTRKILTGDITCTSDTPAPVTPHISISSAVPNLFTAPDDVELPAHGEESFTVTFHPKGTLTYQATLDLIVEGVSVVTIQLEGDAQLSP